MTGKDLSIFNSLRPFSIGFDDMFEQFENMLGNGSLNSTKETCNLSTCGEKSPQVRLTLI